MPDGDSTRQFEEAIEAQIREALPLSHDWISAYERDRRKQVLERRDLPEQRHRDIFPKPCIGLPKTGGRCSHLLKNRLLVGKLACICLLRRTMPIYYLVEVTPSEAKDGQIQVDGKSVSIVDMKLTLHKPLTPVTFEYFAAEQGPV